MTLVCDQQANADRAARWRKDCRVYTDHVFILNASPFREKRDRASCVRKAGIVSARGRDIGSNPYDNYLQIDAPINKGNSGGPARVTIALCRFNTTRRMAAESYRGLLQRLRHEQCTRQLLNRELAQAVNPSTQ
jgi:hypothetical protein